MPARFKWGVPRSPRTDSQRNRVYRMENEAIGGRHYCQLSDLEILARAKNVCELYSVPQAKVSWDDLGRWAAEWKDGSIRLNRNKVTSRSILTILHELAHHVHWGLGGEVSSQHENHGPEFVWCYMSLLDTSRIIPVFGMRPICDAYQVKYHDPGTRQSLVRLMRICQGQASLPQKRRHKE